MEINLNDIPEEVVLLTGLEDAIIGITEEFGGVNRVIYSKNKIIEIFKKRDGMTEEESFEFYDYNVLGLYVSEQNPIFLID